MGERIAGGVTRPSQQKPEREESNAGSGHRGAPRDRLHPDVTGQNLLLDRVLLTSAF
jgi:hypothetical protein